MKNTKDDYRKLNTKYRGRSDRKHFKEVIAVLVEALSKYLFENTDKKLQP